jgi:hypothetical protein
MLQVNDNPTQEALVLWPGSPKFTCVSGGATEVWVNGRLELIFDQGIQRWRAQCVTVGTTGWHVGPDVAFLALQSKAQEWEVALAELARFAGECSRGTREGYESAEPQKPGTFDRNRTSMCGFSGVAYGE